MRNKQMENKYKLGLICAVIVGVSAVMGSGTGGMASETEEIKVTEAMVNDIVLEVQETESESETESEMQTESESETESEVQTESESETESEVQTESESETESEMRTESESETESEVQTESESETESEVQTESESETESEVQTESESEKESEVQMESESETESEVQTDSENETESEVQTESGSKAESELPAELESETESGTEREMESETMEGTGNETESEVQTESESETESEVITEFENEIESEVLTESESETESKAVTESENEGESEQETEPKPEQKPESRPEPSKIYRGKDYEITGEPNAYFRDAEGRLWVRTGTDIRIEPKNGNASDRKLEVQNLQKDGEVTFSLQKKEKGDTDSRESAVASERYYVDGEVPAAEIGVDGRLADGMIFGTTGINASVQLAPDAKSGMKKVVYRVVPCSFDGIVQGQLQNAADTSWKEWKQGQDILLPEEGIYQIFVRSEDQVGNIAFSGSKPVCVDKTPPMIEINGVMDQTANSGALPIRVICKDPAYEQGSLTVDIQGINTGRSPDVQAKQEKSDGAEISFYDFPKEQMYDDVYRMTVGASDKAGNRSEKSLEFSINRYGSVYKLSEPTVQELEDYYISEGKDIVFYETNIDYVGESSLYVRHNGELKELVRGQDYQVTMNGSENTWKKYCYTVPADRFQKEGVYELLLTSVDRADNASDTGLQEQSVAFVLDHTIPEVFISGIEAEHIYEAESVTAAITPSDTGGVNCVRVYVNGELEQEYSDTKTDETIYHVLKENPEWQKIQISAVDMAGNTYQSEEIPVLIRRKTALVESGDAEAGSASALAAAKRDQILLWSGIGSFLLTVIGNICMRKRKEK